MCEELNAKTAAELREIAAGLEHKAVKGYAQRNKAHLLAALGKALGDRYARSPQSGRGGHSWRQDAYPRVEEEARLCRRRKRSGAASQRFAPHIRPKREIRKIMV